MDDYGRLFVSGYRDLTRAHNAKSMAQSIEISDQLYQRLNSHLDEEETCEEFIEELLNIYETEGTFLHEGYSE